MILRHLSNLSKKYLLFLITTAVFTGLLFIIIPDEYKIELSLIILAIVLFEIVAFRNFFKGLCILLFINPLLFSVEMGSNFPISLQGIVSIVIILIGISYFLLEGLPKKGKEFPAVKPFLFILLFSSFSIFYSSHIPSLLIKFGRFASYLSLYILLVANLDSWEKVESSIRVVYLSYLIPIFIAILQFLGVFPLEANLLELEKIGIMSKNNFGITVAMLTLFLIGQKVFANKSLFKLIRTNILYIVPLIILLILSTTRTAWVGFIGTLFLILVLYGRAKNKIAITLCLLIIASIFWFPIVERVQDLLKTMSGQSTTTYSSSFEGRIFLYWPQGIEAWLERPVLGHGLGSTSYLAYRLSNIIDKSPHSEYIQMLQELGILGSILYVFLLWRFLSPMLKMNKVLSRTKLVDRRTHTFLGSLMLYIGFIIMSFGQDTFHNGAIGTLFVTLMAIAQAAYLLLRKDLQTGCCRG